MTTTDTNQLIKAFVKTLKEANIIATTDTSDLTSTQFECFTTECLRVVMDSLDIEPGTVVVVDGWEAMCLVSTGDKDEKAWIGFDGRTYTHEQFAQTARSAHDVVRVVHYGII